MGKIVTKGNNSFYQDGGKSTPVELVQSEDGETAYRATDGSNTIYSIPKEYEPSFRDYAQQVLGQGTLMGFGDEILGGIQGSYDTLTGEGGWGENVDKRIDAERARMKQTEDSLGTLKTLALQAGGGLLTGGVGAGRAIAGKGLSMGAKALRGATQGGIQGAITGAGMAEGGVGERAIPAAQGAGFGVLGGAALPALAHGATELGKGALRMLPGGVDRQAKSLIRGTVPQKAVPRMERDLARMPHGVVADVAPTDARRITGEAMRTVGGGKQVDIMAARHKGQYQRIKPKMEVIVGGKNVNEALDDLSKLRRTTADENYGKFYENPVELTPQLKKSFADEDFQEAYKLAQKIARREGVQLPPLYNNADGVVSYATPNARMLDYMKQGMDAMVDQSYKTEGGTLGRSIQTVRNDFRDYLDELLPDYKKARSEYAGLSASMEAMETGRKFLRSAMSEEGGKFAGGVDAKDIARMGEHELESFRMGVASVVREKLGAPKPGANIATVFDSNNVKEKIRTALGPERAKEFYRVLGDEAKMAMTWAENQGSQTAQRASAKMSMGTDLVDATATAATGGVPLLSMARAAANKVAPQPESVAARISQLMASPKAADKMEAFRIMKSGGITQPLGYLGGMAQGSTAGIGGYLGGKYGAE